MTRQARWALGLWTLLALVVFNVTFDWQTRLAGLERAQLTVQAHSRAALQKFLRAWRERLDASGERKVRWALDVDPLEL